MWQPQKLDDDAFWQMRRVVVNLVRKEHRGLDCISQHKHELFDSPAECLPCGNHRSWRAAQKIVHSAMQLCLSKWKLSSTKDE
jgi:hypothetical protein